MMRRHKQLTHIRRDLALVIVLVVAGVMWGMHAHTVRRAESETDSERAEPPGPHFESEYAVGIVPIEELPRTPPFAEQIAEHATLFAAIRQVESGIGPVGVGGAGERGDYQITKAYWQDACDYAVDMGYLTEPWDYDSLVWVQSYAEQVMCWYWERYVATTDEQRARLHNGGPDGPTNPKTIPYSNSVLALMERDAKCKTNKQAE